MHTLCEFQKVAFGWRMMEKMTQKCCGNLNNSHEKAFPIWPQSILFGWKHSWADKRASFWMKNCRWFPGTVVEKPNCLPTVSLSKVISPKGEWVTLQQMAEQVTWGLCYTGGFGLRPPSGIYLTAKWWWWGVHCPWPCESIWHLLRHLYCFNNNKSLILPSNPEERVDFPNFKLLKSALWLIL